MVKYTMIKYMHESMMELVGTEIVTELVTELVTEIVMEIATEIQLFKRDGVACSVEGYKVY